LQGLDYHLCVVFLESFARMRLSSVCRSLEDLCKDKIIISMCLLLERFARLQCGMQRQERERERERESLSLANVALFSQELVL
jgi:hypothetical protein